MNEVEQRLREIEERWKRTSTGPWRVAVGQDDAAKDWFIANLADGNDGQEYFVTTNMVRASEFDGDAKDDAEFIAHSKDDVPWLLSLLREREEENRRLREALMAANYWYRRKGPSGQALAELSCGHGGPLGAPMCKACTNKALDEAMRRETP